MAHKTKIGGTAYEIGSGKVLVGGTGYSIDKGRTKVDGTGYDVSFTLTVGSLPIGGSVFLTAKKYGVKQTREFIVVNQGIPQESDYYDETADGTWLLLNGVLSSGTYGSYGNFYQSSDIKARFESYFNEFDSNIQSTIKEVRIPYVNNSGNGYLKYGSAGLPSKVFALSAREVGLSSSIAQNSHSEGARLDYFSSNEVDAKRIVNYNGIPVNWWLRSPQKANQQYVHTVLENGGYALNLYTTQQYSRPALVLPKETLLDEAHYIIA